MSQTRAQALAIQILTTTAEHLGTLRPARLTDGQRTAVFQHALDTVLGDATGKYHRARARSLAQASLPPLEGTTVEYAARLRETAVARG